MLLIITIILAVPKGLSRVTEGLPLGWLPFSHDGMKSSSAKTLFTNNQGKAKSFFCIFIPGAATQFNQLCPPGMPETNKLPKLFRDCIFKNFGR